MKKLILASKSARRRELLEMLGADFDIITREVDESYEGEIPFENYIKIDNSHLEAEEVAKIIKW